jgi:urocanate hydratase
MTSYRDISTDFSQKLLFSAADFANLLATSLIKITTITKDQKTNENVLKYMREMMYNNESKEKKVERVALFVAAIRSKMSEQNKVMRNFISLSTYVFLCGKAATRKCVHKHTDTASDFVYFNKN